MRRRFLRDDRGPEIPLLLKWKYNACWLGEHLFGPLFSKTLRARANRQIHSYLMSLPPREAITPEIFDNAGVTDPEFFLREVLPLRRPVIFRGAAKEWKCCREWAPADSTSRFKDYDLIVASPEPGKEGAPQQITLGDFLGKEGPAKINPHRFNCLAKNMVKDFPELNEIFQLSRLRKLKRKTDLHLNTLVFMGPDTAHTLIHSEMIDNVFVQAQGTKRWRIFPPKYNALFFAPMERAATFRASSSYAEVPDGESVFDRLERYDFLMEPGDVLFNPSFHWHYVKNESASLSASLRTVSLVSALRSSPLLTFFSFTALHPFIGVLNILAGDRGFTTYDGPVFGVNSPASLPPKASRLETPEKSKNRLEG